MVQIPEMRDARNQSWPIFRIAIERLVDRFFPVSLTMKTNIRWIEHKTQNEEGKRNHQSAASP
jgi:hypothetical protein